MLASGNGRGKTTILECIYFAMRLLAPDFPNGTDLRHDIVAERDGRLQLDIIVEMEVRQASRIILLSLSWGDVEAAGLSGWERRSAGGWAGRPMAAVRWMERHAVAF